MSKSYRFLVADKGEYSPDFLSPCLPESPMHWTTVLSFLGFPATKVDSNTSLILSYHSYTVITVKVSITQ